MTKHLITSSLLILLGIYQARNIVVGRNLKRPLRTYVPLSLKYGEKTLFTIVVPSFQPVSRCDTSSKELGELGFIVRYKMGQFPYDSFFGVKGKTPRRLFVRDDYHLMYSRTIAGLKENALLAQMADIKAKLEKAGVTLVIVLVPPHLAMERDFMPSGPLPPLNQWNEFQDPGPEDPYGVYRSVVETTHLPILDLYNLYRDHQHTNPDSLLYFPGDSHWSSLGIAVAAQGVLRFLQHRGTKADIGKVLFDGFNEDKIPSQLVEYLQLPTAYVTSNPDLHWSEPLYILKNDRRRRLTATGDGRLFVLGTSFTARLRGTGYGFAEMLAAGLGKKMTMFVAAGGGATHGWHRLKSEGITLRRGDTVVWEMPFDSIWADRNKGLPEPPVSTN